MARPTTAQRTLQSVDAVRHLLRLARQLDRAQNAWNARGRDITRLRSDELQMLRQILAGSLLLTAAALELHLPDEET